MNPEVGSPFRLLLKLFYARFLENDTVSPGGGYQTNIYQVIAVLFTIGLMVVGLMGSLVGLTLFPGRPESYWELRGLRVFFAALSFGVGGFAAIFHWDMLFPDRRDFLILAPFPIALRELVGAKFVALLSFLMLVVAVLNAVHYAVLLLTAIFVRNVGSMGIRLAGAHVAATAGAALFAFLAVAGLQGLLINLTSPKIFRRISPWIQMAGMSLMVLTVLDFPLYVALFPLAVNQRQLWVYLFPPVWFSGLYEMFLGGSDQFLVWAGALAIKMTGLALLLVLITWGFGFRRHFRRTLESEDAPRRPRAWKAPQWLAKTPQENALFGFVGKTLARSQKHQFFLAAYLSAGLSLATFVGASLHDGKLALSPGGSRAVAFVIGFFLISGFRMVFQFPAELGANWLFRMTEGRWTEVSRRATRKLVLVAGLSGALFLALPLEMSVWNWPTVLLHSAVQLTAVALLVEALFWDFDKVPFTCSYFPGRTSLALLIVLYAYGLTGYSFNLADLERTMERHAIAAPLFFLAAAGGLILSWRRNPAAAAVRFDGGDPTIQTLELT